jgi:hypothetical protein
LVDFNKNYLALEERASRSQLRRRNTYSGGFEMPSSAYHAIRVAMEAQQQVTCTYQGRYREICAHAIGYKDGREKILGFQFAGESAKGLPPEGEWRCMFIDQISDVAVKDGPWRTRDDHSRPQTCIDEIDLEVLA